MATWTDEQLLWWVEVLEKHDPGLTRSEVIGAVEVATLHDVGRDRIEEVMDRRDSLRDSEEVREVKRHPHWTSPTHQAEGHLGTFAMHVRALHRRGVPVEDIQQAVKEIADGLEESPIGERILKRLVDYFTSEWEKANDREQKGS